MSAGSDVAQGLMYYLLVIDGEEVNAKINPAELPRTTEAPNVEVKLSQLLYNPDTGYLKRAYDRFYYDGDQLFCCEPTAPSAAPTG